MTGGTLTGTGGDGNGTYSLLNTNGVTATSDASGNAALISAGKISLQGGTTTFNVTQGAAPAPASDLTVSSVITGFNGNGNGIIKTGSGIMTLTNARTPTPAGRR